MNAAHLHLILVHIPIVLIPTATILLFLALWRKQPVVANTSLSLFIIATLVCVPAFLLGEDAEEIVEDQPGVVEDTIEEHEEAAELSLWLTVAVGGVALLALGTKRSLPTLQPPALKLLAVLGTTASVALSYTGFEGGKIRHPEAYGSDPSKAAEHAGHNDHDD
jgi:hypothetical protein